MIIRTGPPHQQNCMQKNGELNNPMALLVIGPAEQQSVFQNQVKLLLRVLPDGFAVMWLSYGGVGALEQ